MKKIIFLSSIPFLILQSCSSSDSNSSETSVIDIDGNTYQAIAIGNQIWTKSNLNVSRYKNGDVIPQVSDPLQWGTLTTGAWCYCNNDTANGPVYGKLYNWYAVNDPRGLAPTGYHIPSDAEWTNLSNFLGGEEIAGGKMKETGTTHWQTPNTGANNSSGFSGLPGAFRNHLGQFLNAGIGFGGQAGAWWTSSEYNNQGAWERFLSYDNAFLYRDNNWGKIAGHSIRCVKD